MTLQDAHIIGYMQRTSGVHYHRILLPISGLGLEKTLVTNDLDLIKARAAEGRLNILLLNRYIPNLPAAELVAMRYRYGFKIVLDLDDYWNLDPHHVLFYDYQNIRTEILAMLQVADVVTVTHWRLAKKCMEVTARPVFVVPNALPFDQGQFNATRVPSESGRIRLGWAGGITHEADLNILRGPMKRLADQVYLKELVEMRIFGYNEANDLSRKVWGSMASAFTASGRLYHQAFPPLDPEHYMACYTGMDLALVPLVESTFNGYKSNLKLLEAGTKNIPVICSKVLPYYEGQDIPGVRFVENQRQWGQHIRHLVLKPDTMEAAGRALGEWVRENFHLARWSPVRAEIFNKILN